MWIHNKSGNTYEVISWAARMQVDGVWIDSVVYKGVTVQSELIFTRSKEDFLEKFVKINMTYTGVR